MEQKLLAQEIVEKDRDSLYIGNLNTVEFDLTLPSKGAFGSDITWESGHERYLTPEGKVTRPPYGMGDRLVPLYATFAYEDAVAKKKYDVKILEEANKLKVTKVYPVYVQAQTGKDAYIPKQTVVQTEEGDTIPHAVEWNGGDKVCYGEAGIYKVQGFVAGTAYEAVAEIQVADEIQVSYKDKTPLVDCCDRAKIRISEGSAFYDCQERMRAFLLSVNDDQMLYNFRTASGLDTKGAPIMYGWDSPECQLRGHTTGHYMSGLALCYRATGDKKIKEKAMYMVEELAKCQDKFATMDGIKPGFLSGYSEEQFDQLEEFTVYPIIWAPYYTLHKIFAGLLDCYRYLPSEKALDIATKLGMWTWNRLSRLSHETLSKMWSMYIAGEYGGMNEVMAELYEITGKEEFLKCARLFDNDKLFYPLSQDIDALSTIHANQHIPQIVGAMEMFKATGEERYYEISKNFWKFVTGSHVYATGGTGETEMFHKVDEIGALLTENTEESCASYNMLKLTRELFKYNPDARLMDYYENTVTNHILATQEKKVTGESTYFLPLGPGMKRSFYAENSCCHGTGMESHFKYRDAIYFYEEDTLGINLFVPSSLDWKEKNTSAEILLEKENPEHIQIKVFGDVKNLKIRKPYWAEEYFAMLNGNEVEVSVDEKGYLNFAKNENNACIIDLVFPYHFQIRRAADLPEKAAVSYGPYVLAALSDSQEFIKVSFNEETIEDEMEKLEDEIAFECDGVKWIPLHLVDEEAYHVYVECEK